MSIEVRLARGRRLVPIALALALTACSSDDDGTGNNPPGDGSVAGVVTSDGAGVTGAQIALAGTETGNATTGADGRYRFDGLAPGSYTLTLAVPAGFDLAAGHAAAKSATVVEGQTATVDWLLSAQTTTGAIAGRVAAGASGVGGAAIALTGTASGNTTTAADGTYRFDALAPGPYALTLTVPAGFELAAGQTADQAATVVVGEAAAVDWSLVDLGSDDVVEITLAGTSFSPENVTIAPGTTVRWVAANGVHTVTPDDPGQSGVWADRGLSAGQSFEHTFDVTGTFDYHCQPHQSLGMVGRIVVE